MHSLSSFLIEKGRMIFKGQDAWRTLPIFQGLWKSPFPGFRNAVVIYGVFAGAEWFAKQQGLLGPSQH
jgi:hypothetical protein